MIVAIVALASAVAYLCGSIRKGRAPLNSHDDTKATPPSAPEARVTIFQQLAESIRQVFWMADTQRGRLIYVSPAMLELWLIEPQVIINDPTQWFASIHPADRGSAEETLSSMLSGVANSCEYRIIRPDGEIRFVRNRSFPVRDSSGSITRAAGILEDVTSERDAQRALRQSRDELVQHVNELKSENRERRRAEEELRSAKDLAEAANRAKSQFLRNISHELRTPLNGIMGMVQIASETKEADDQRQCLQSAAGSAAHLLAIVDNILEFSESETGRIEITPAPFELRKCVRDVTKRIAHQATGKQLGFSYFVSAKAPETVTGDPSRLAQVLTHLLSNAVKFTNQGSVWLEVFPIEGAGNEHRLQFVICDTGIGVADESRKAIFEAFTQVDGSLTRPYGGLGLGLSLCARLVALMGGEISLESEPGKGSRFGFTIPLRSNLAGPTGSNGDALAAYSVLVIEGSLGNRRAAELALGEAGLHVLFCVDARQALAEVERGTDRFLAIMLGAKLPNSNSLALAARLCADYGLRNKLLLTIDADQEQQLRMARELGIGRCFAQPVNYNEVLDSIRALVPQPVLRPKSLRAAKPHLLGPSLQVLVVEDNPINQTVLKRMLEKLGHSVVTADNGLLALSTLERVAWNVDLVLMDVQMPELDGYETTERIRETERGRGGHLPIIAATAHAMTGDAERCLNAEMDAYITKPIQMEALSRVIAKVIAASPIVPLERKVS